MGLRASLNGVSLLSVTRRGHRSSYLSLFFATEFQNRGSLFPRWQIVWLEPARFFGTRDGKHDLPR